MAGQGAKHSSPATQETKGDAQAPAAAGWPCRAAGFHASCAWSLDLGAAEPSNRLPEYITPPPQEYCNCGKQCGCCPSPAGERCEPCRRVGGQGGEPAKPAIQPVVQLVRNAVVLLFGGLQWLLLAPLCRSLRCAASQPRPAHPAPSCCRAAVSARRSPAPAPMSATVAS